MLCQGVPNGPPEGSAALALGLRAVVEFFREGLVAERGQERAGTAHLRAYLDGGGNPDAPGHFIAWLSERTPLEATRLDGRWIDIGSADDLARANAG